MSNHSDNSTSVSFTQRIVLFTKDQYRNISNPENHKQGYTSGPIASTMIRTAFMMLAGTLAISGYNLVDGYFVGRLGEIPLASMGLTLPLVMLVSCVLHGMASGVMTTAAQAVGAKRNDKAAKLVTSGLLFSIVVSILLGLLGVLTSNWVLMKGLKASAEAAPLAREYMNIWYAGCVTATLGMCGNNVLIAVGDSRLASRMMLLGLFVNTLLDPLFIFGFDMGIQGAALATVLAQLIGMCFILYFLWKRHHLLRFQWIPIPSLLRFWRRISDFAIPSALGMLMVPIASFATTRVANAFGDTIVAAVSTEGRIESLAFVFPMALGMSLLPMIGQNYGARLYSRIHTCRRVALRFALCFLFSMAILFAIFAEPLAAIFTREAPEVRPWIVLGLRIIPWGFPFIEIHRYSTFFFTGCGHPVAAALLNAMRVIGFLLPFLMIAKHLQYIPAIFIARTAADVISGIIGWYLVHRLTKNFPADGEHDPRVKH